MNRLMGFEVLERRMLLAGTVLVEVKSGDLIVTGDKNAEDPNDEIQIVRQADGKY